MNETLPRNAATPITAIGYGSRIASVNPRFVPIKSNPALLNAEIAWKRLPHHVPAGVLWIANHGTSSRNVVPSTATVKIITRSVRTFHSLTSASSMPKNCREARPKRPPSKRISAPAYIVTPRPPAWISTAITISPKRLQ